MQKQEVKKFIKRALLFLSPFLVLWVIELFVLPINYFTFRTPEALTVHSFLGKALLPGSFYPNYTVTGTEVGGLGVHTSHTSPQETVWYTDGLGNRQRPRPRIEQGVSSPVVAIGDSYLAGLTLTQDDALPAQLARVTGKDIYSVDFSGSDYFLSDAFPEKEKPEVVILEASEKSLLHVPFVDGPGKVTQLKRKEQSYRNTPPLRFLQPVSVLVDRMSKQNMYRALRADVDNFFSPKELIAYDVPEFNLFDTDPQAYQVPTEEDLDRIVTGLSEVSRRLEEQGIRFIFLPIPNKETIYWQSFPGRIRPTFLPNLVVQLREKGVEYLDTQSLFEKEFQNNKTKLYQMDDYHWNRKGVEITAEALGELLEQTQ